MGYTEYILYFSTFLYFLIGNALPSFLYFPEFFLTVKIRFPLSTVSP